MTETYAPSNGDIDAAPGHDEQQAAPRDPEPEYSHLNIRIEQIPKVISDAICQVQTHVDAITKDNENDHGGYNYASVDQVYASLTLKLGQVGLAIIPIEAAPMKILQLQGKNGPQKWARFLFGFIYSVGDVTWYCPYNTETLLVQVTGPQSFGAAKSYASKAHYRALFKIPTGDLDLDEIPQEESEEEAGKRLAKKPARKKKVEVYDEDKSADIGKTFFAFFCDDKSIRKGLDSKTLDEWVANNGAELDKLQEHDKEAVRLAFAAKPGQRVLIKKREAKA